MQCMYTKLEKLKNYLKDLNKAAIAFSAGVDSTFLLKIAKEVLGSNIIAISANFHSFPQKELNEAIEFCRKEKIKHIIIEFNELDIEGFKNNPPNRCYLCKKELFKTIKETAKLNNIENIIEGSNIDDDSDYRPGMQALKELGIKSPLKEVKLTKEEIRNLSKDYNLSTAEKQSSACLSSRFAYNETITEEKLQMVDKAEQLLKDLGFHQVRVRIHNLLARIEIDENEFNKIMQKEIRQKIINDFKKFGFIYISLDLKGYRTGSMNESLK